MTKIVVLGAGISGLSTAYALENFARREELDIEILVLEKLDRSGGKIMSVKSEGFLCEWGPNGFLDNKPMTLDLCRALGVDSVLLRSSDNARKRFIYAAETLHRLPEDAISFFKSKLISWPGKLRLGCEMLIPAKRGTVDETLAAFARRRLGAEALDRLIGPMVSGIFAGDPETMSLRSCFPRIYQLEQEYGGLIKAMAKLGKKSRAERKAGKQVASAAGPGGVLTSFTGGIQELTDSLIEKLQAKVLTDSGVARIEKKQGGFLLHLEDQSRIEAEMVISSVPAHALSGMLAELDSESASLLNQIPYASMNVVCFGYQQDRISRDLEGFGYLIAKGEKRNTLGTLWDSSIFPNRAPEGHVLLRSMLGGATNPQAINFSEDEVRQKTMADLKKIMGIEAAPDFVRIFRHRQAIPQYIPGHGARLAALDSRMDNFKGLFLTGNAFSGVGINDCVNASNQIAEKVITALKQQRL
ncbi:protoporphyrinogen oxidase [Geopsychrobacter electrodiphilus]|uniref:protoporphyrinogen oxidase n=1 Tax=Geopsychrobacter electrodiphilus TaxID=225196 RepID=UPI00036B15E8|nr:protoporphyrinogen oxidase [Geopsychrobacter electrodiphilus]